MRIRAALFAASALVVALAPRAARAEGKAEDAPPANESAPKPWENASSHHRSGFMVALTYGVGVANVSGFPNDPRKIGFSAYYTNTGVRPVAEGTILLGGAITDWFNFAVGTGGGQMFGTGDLKVGGGGIVFHLDAYPMLALFNRYPNLGVSAEFGTGGFTVTPKDNTDKKLIDSGAASIVAGGVFWEPLKTWRIKMGPFLMGTYTWSDSIRRPAILLGFRSALYASKVEPQ